MLERGDSVIREPGCRYEARATGARRDAEPAVQWTLTGRQGEKRRVRKRSELHTPFHHVLVGAMSCEGRPRPQVRPRVVWFF